MEIPNLISAHLKNKNFKIRRALKEKILEQIAIPARDAIQTNPQMGQIMESRQNMTLNLDEYRSAASTKYMYKISTLRIQKTKKERLNIYNILINPQAFGMVFKARNLGVRS